MLDAAAELFYRQGIHAIGVDAIAAKAGVTKRTLYVSFGSKDQLVAAYLTERDHRWRAWLTGWVDGNADSPADKILAVFDALGVWIAQEDFRGCGFVNALAELPSVDHPAREVITAQTRWMETYFARLAERANMANPEEFAATALLLYEGATVAASKGMADAPRHAREALAALMISP